MPYEYILSTLRCVYICIYAHKYVYVFGMNTNLWCPFSPLISSDLYPARKIEAMYGHL